MKLGDLVQKRWGRIEPFQQGTAGLIVDVDGIPGAEFVVVLYPDSLKRGVQYKAAEFEVISEGR
mgnify:CR=1 FL=1